MVAAGTGRDSARGGGEVIALERGITVYPARSEAGRRLCDRFAAPVIGAVTCQDIKTAHAQVIVNAAPTAGEGDRVDPDGVFRTSHGRD